MAKLVKGGDGKMYEEVINPSTKKAEYIPVSAETVREIQGQKVAVRSTQEYERAHDSNSHLNFLKDARNAKQTLKRQDALTKQVTQFLSEQRPRAHGPDIKEVTDEQWMNMRNDPDWLPLASYAQKLIRVRPILQGEVGMMKDKPTIYILQEGERFFGVKPGADGSSTSEGGGSNGE